MNLTWSRIWPIRPWWTPKYFLNKTCVWVYEKNHPDYPWLTKESNKILASLLKPSHAGLEWGSGRSTVWFAYRAASLTSVETEPYWYERIKKQMIESGISNVNYILCNEKEDLESYVGVIKQFDNNSLDFALVDGAFRSVCANQVVEKIRNGGYLIVDDVNRFLPCNSISPKSRTKQTGPRRDAWWERLDGLGWADFLAKIKEWRCIWTSNGLKDTAIWFKPIQ
jgi:hypothetical protein